MLQAGKAVVRGQKLELLHGEQVVVDGERTLLENRRDLVLTGRDLVVLGAHGYAEFPELVIHLLHEGVDSGADGAKVVLLQLLPLGRLAAKEGSAAEDKVGAGLEVLFLDKKVLLLGTAGGDHAPGPLTEEGERALGLLLDGDLGAQERRLLVERLSGVGDEGCGNAEHLILDEDGTHGVPYGVATSLKGGAKPP